ncbi:MAG TPA: hypothetical protein V6D29_08820 [Leptolyngbyaceae cyanobacterium]
MSSTNVGSASSTPSSILNPGDSSLILDPNLEFLSGNTLLSLLGGFSSDLQVEVENFIDSLDEAEGEISIDSGIITTNLSFQDGTAVQGTVDTPTAFLNLAELAASSNGTLTLEGGLVTGELTTEESTLTLDNFDFAAATGSLVGGWLNALEGTFAFDDGVLPINAATPFGAITGTVGFAKGALTLDLLTPAGAIAGSVDFDDDAVIPFDIGLGTGSVTGAVDFNQGVVAIPLFPGFSATVPLEELEGSVTLDDGVATLALETNFGTFPVAVEFGQMASEMVSDFLTDVSGSVTVTNGVLEGVLDTSFGPFSTTVNLVDLANQAASFAQQVSGSISVAGGSATALLDTPLGVIDQVIDLTNTDSLLSTPLVNLFG